MLAFPMIETAEGMTNLSSIAATRGLDGIYVGPADLTLGLAQGRLAPGFDREEPEMIAPLKEIAATCKANRLCAALLCGTPGYAVRAIEWGFEIADLTWRAPRWHSSQFLCGLARDAIEKEWLRSLFSPPSRFR
jgi:4-hydroxy-2-oxoheptanedioate aldolase